MKNLRKIQRFFVYSALASLAVIIIFLILAIFKVSNEITWKIVLCLLYIFAGSVFGINAFTYVDKNKTLSFVSLGFIAVSVVLAFIATLLNVSTFMIRVTGTVAILTAFLVILISTTLKASNRFKAIQLILYILCIMIDIVLTIQVWDGHLFKSNLFTQFFTGAVIIAAGLLITISVLSKRTIDDNDKVTISKAEYEELKEKAALYDKMKGE